MSAYPDNFPSHGNAITLSVSATIATEAIAVCLDTRPASANTLAEDDFAALPPRMKARVLAACEEEFRRARRALAKTELAAGHLDFADAALDAADNEAISRE